MCMQETWSPAWDTVHFHISKWPCELQGEGQVKDVKSP